MDFKIEPDVAESLADAAEDSEQEEFFRSIAEGDEPHTRSLPDEEGKELAEKLLLTVMLRELLESLDEISEGLTRYDAGRLRGVLETLHLINNEGELPDVSDEQKEELFPKSVLEMKDET